MTRTKALLLFSLGLLGLILWRLNQPTAAPNLLVNADFEQADLTGWQIAKAGEAQVVSGLSDESGNLLALEIPDPAQGSWVGVGQRLALAPLQRYRLLTRYRLVYEGQSSARLVLRVSQFDQKGELIKTTEVSNPGPLVAQSHRGALNWSLQQQVFVTDEQAAAVEIGIGLLGNQATKLEIDNTVLELYPTGFTKVRQDNIILFAILGLLGLSDYGLGRMLWPFRRRIIVNTGLAVASLVVTLLAAEILARFIPISLISPNWPAGYHIPFMEGKSYRLAYNFPATVVSDNNGDRHLAVSNSLGVRDVEVPQGNNQIVVVLGDSMTFGWAISDLNDTWTRRLDMEIKRMMSGSNYHFVNTGVSAYNTFQEVSLFKTLLKDMAQQGLRPKIALLSFFSGIWERNQFGLDGGFSILNGVLMYSSVKQALLELAGRLVDQSQFDDLKLIGATRLNGPHQFLLAKSRLYFILSLLLVNRLDENWDVPPANVDPVAINYQALESFKNMAEANGIQPIVAYLPADNLFTPSKLGKNEERVAQLSEICQSLGMSFINPYENMKKLGINAQNSKEKLTLVYNRHYSAEGNALYARALAPLLANLLNQRQQAAHE